MSRRLRPVALMTVKDLRKEVQALRERLEMTHYFRWDRTARKMIRMDGFCGYDAVDCRNATISMLENDIREAGKRLRDKK